jgi:aryl carrier-like protein
MSMTVSGNAADEPLTIDELREAVASILDTQPGSIADDVNLIHLGVDSLGIMRLVNLWRRKGIRVSSRELAAEPTLAAWQRHLERLRLAARDERPGE